MLVSLLVVLALSSMPAMAFQEGGASSESADTVRTSPPGGNDEEEVRLRPRVYPGAFVSTTYGWGIGVGARIDNVTGNGSSVLLTARPAQHRGAYTLSYYSADRHAAPTFVHVGIDLYDTGRQRFWGMGPMSSRSALVYLEREHVELDLKLGIRTFRRKLLIQSGVRLLHHTVQGFTEESDGAMGRMTPSSLDHLAFVTDEANDRLLGIAYGLESALDSRDRYDLARRGTLLQATAYRYSFLNEPDLAFNRVTAGAYGFIPLTTKGTLAVRTIVVITRGQPSDETPFYLLPPLDRRLLPAYPSQRFFGRDLFLVGAEYRHLLLAQMGFGIEGTFTLQAASVYDDVFSQFEPSITLAKEFTPGTTSFPLRPGAGLGFRLVSLADDRVHLNGMVAWSPEGFKLMTFSFVHDLFRRDSVFH